MVSYVLAFVICRVAPVRFGWVMVSLWNGSFPKLKREKGSSGSGFGS